MRNEPSHRRKGQFSKIVTEDARDEMMSGRCITYELKDAQTVYTDDKRI